MVTLTVLLTVSVIVMVVGVHKKSISISLCGALSTAIFGYFLLLLVAGKPQEPYCLLLDNKAYAITDFNANTNNILYVKDGIQYKIPSQDISIKLSKGKCNVAH